jgi:hypothetical protein
LNSEIRCQGFLVPPALAQGYRIPLDSPIDVFTHFGSQRNSPYPPQTSGLARDCASGYFEIQDKPLSGYFCVQSHTKRIEFRNLQMKAL